MSKECWPVECRLLKSLVFTVLVTNQGQVLLVSTHMGVEPLNGSPELLVRHWSGYRLDGRLGEESKSVEEEAWNWVIRMEFSLPKGLMSLLPLLC